MTSVILKRLVYNVADDTSPDMLKAKARKEESFDLFSGLTANQAIKKTEKLTRFFLKYRNKIVQNHLENLKSGFSRLCLRYKRAILTKIAFNKIKTLILKKSLEAIYNFFNRAAKPGTFRWKTLKNFEEKSGLSLKNWDFERKIHQSEEFNKIRKIILDFSVGGNSPYEKNIAFCVINVFISHKYGIKILRLLFETIRKKQLSEGFSQMMSANAKKKPPKVLETYLLGKIKEKEDLHQFLKSEQKDPRFHKSHEKILRLHNQELDKIHAKLQSPRKIPLRNRESLILSNWAGQIIHRIQRFYRREFLNTGFTKIYRYYQREKYHRKVIISLYEKYRSARLRDLTTRFINWKIKGFDFEKYRKLRGLFDPIEKIVTRTKKQRFFEFLMRVAGGQDGKLQRVSNKIKGGMLLLAVFNRKRLVLLEYAFMRTRNEDLLEELSLKMLAIEKISEFIRVSAVRRGFTKLAEKGVLERRLETLVKRTDYLFRVRKVVFFYRMLAFARLNNKN